MVLGPLLHEEGRAGRKFKDATFHEIAGIMIGQLQRMLTLLEREHAEYPPVAFNQALTANTPVLAFTATRKVYLRMMALSASAACNILISTVHPTTGPGKIPAFYCQAAAAGALPIGEHEFVMPRDATLFVQADQNATIQLTASVFDGEEPALIMNYEM